MKYFPFSCLTFLFLLLFHAPFLAQQDELTIEPASHIGGNVSSAVYSEQYGYLAQGGYLTILDLGSQPFSQLGYLDIEGNPTDMLIIDNHLVTIDIGLHIYDLADPVNPVLVSMMDFETGQKPQLDTQGTLLFAATHDGGIKIIDVTDFELPVLLGDYQNGNDLTDVVVSGNYAYALDNTTNQLIILNCSDPAAPVLSGTCPVKNGPTSLAIQDDLAMVTVYSYPDIGLRLFDISDRTHPIEIGYIETKKTVGNTTHYDSPQKVIAQGSLAYVACSAKSSVYVFDITDPANPLEYSHLPLEPEFEGQTRSFQQMDQSLFLSCSWTGKNVQKIDVTNPAIPAVSNQFESPHDPLWIQCSIDHLFIADQRRLWVYDMNDVDHPALLASYPEYNAINRCLLIDDYLYAIRHDTLFMLDITNPHLISLVNTLKLDGMVSELFAAEGYLFVMQYRNPCRMHTFEISDPANPVKLSQFDLPGIGKGIAFDPEGQILVTGYYTNPTTYGFALYNLTDPSNPVLISQTQTTRIPTAIALNNHTVFQAGNRNIGEPDQWQIERYDISDPANPIPDGYFEQEGEIWDLQIQGGYLFAGVPGNTIYGFPLLGLLQILAECPSPTTTQITVSPPNMQTYTGYGASVDGYGYNYPTGFKDISGIDGIPVQKIKWPTPEPCCLATVVRPEIAGTPGPPYDCTSVPSCSSAPCGGQLEVKATPGPEWVFVKWSGAAGGNSPTTNAALSGKLGCPTCADNIAYAHFTPWLKNTGGGSLWNCPFESEEEVTALVFTLQASKADNWTVEGLNISISGDDALSQYIKKARLKWTAEQEKEHSGNGSVNFTTTGLTLEAGKSQEFTLYLTFREMTDIKCPTEPKIITIEVTPADIQAWSMTYPPGKPLGMVLGTFTVSCIRNVSKNLDYTYIQDAVGDADDQQEIWVCPGDYEENVTVDKEKLKLKSTEGPTKTYVLAVENDKPGLSLKANGITIEGFGIRNATQSYGIHVYGSTISDSKLINNRLTNNKLGIFLQDALKTTISHCSAFENKESGLHALNSRETTVENGSFYANDQHGVFFENCTESEQAYSTINQSSARENKLNGIFLKNCKYPVIDNSITLSRNDSAGVRIEDCAHIVVKNNPIVGENKEGVLLLNSKSCQVKDNQIRENTETGILVKNCMPASQSEGNTVSGNIVEGNRLAGKQKQGVGVLNSQYTLLGVAGSINEIRSHARYGILIRGGSKNFIRGDSILMNDLYGIYLENTWGNEISGNNKIGPDNGKGIGLKNCSCEEKDPNEIYQARVMGNKTMGIELDRSSGNRIGAEGRGNTVSGNKENGIELFECNSPFYYQNIIAGNTLTQNGLNGILLSNSDLNTLEKNDIYANEEKGIVLRLNSSTNKIRENRIDGKDIQREGIHIEFSESNLVDQNTVINHPDFGISISDCPVSSFLINNTLEKNKTGIFLERAGGFLIGRMDGLPGPNKLNYNKESGIYIKDCDGKNTSEIAFNECKKNPVGLLIEGSKSFLVTDNQLTEKNIVGIKIQNCDAKTDQAIHLENNFITQCEAQGIYLENTRGVIIGGDLIAQSNQIKKNKGNAIHLKDCKPPYQITGFINRIINNVIYEDNHNGIYLHNCQFNEIKENNIHSNKRDGIHLSNSLWNTLYGNSVRENAGNGIVLNQSEQNKINANESLRNEESGLFLTKSNYNEIPSTGTGKNILTENKDHGIRLDGSQCNTLNDNEIFRNQKHGIVFNHSSFNKVQGPMDVMENIKDGIQLSDSHQNTFWNLIKVSKKQITYAIQIKSNGSQGLHLKNSHNNSFSCMKIWKHTTGLLLEHSNSNAFTMDVRILLNSVGGHGICSYSSTYGLCAYHNNVVTTIQDGCSVVPAWYEGCHFLDSEESGFVLTKGADPTFRNCNFIGAGEWGIDNQNEEGAIDARHNWWGDASGPGGTGPGNGVKLRGNVLFEPWLTEPVNLQASFARDTLYLQADRTDSIYYLVSNVLNPGDSVKVTLQDSLNWPDFQQEYSTGLTDSVGFDSLWRFRYDPAIHPGEWNKWVLQAESLVFPGQTARDSVYLVTYEPVLRQILLFPDSLELTLGESWSFRPILLDQHGKELDIGLVWWSNADGLDENGLFQAGEIGTWYVWVSDLNGTDTARVVVFVREFPELSDIQLDPPAAELMLGDTLQFEAYGWDQFSNPFSFIPVWYADGGIIDSIGLYRATEEGQFTVTAGNPENTLSGSADVWVILVHTLEADSTKDPFILYPNYPNPFSEQTTFRFELYESSPLTITIYDATGKKCLLIGKRWYTPGYYEVRLDTGSFQSGTYFYDIERNGERRTGKMIKH